MKNNELTTIQISKSTLREVRAFCKKNHYIQRYWLESLLKNTVKAGKGSGQS